MKIKVQTLTPGEVGKVLLQSLEGDLFPWTPEPTPSNLETIARWAKACGLEVKARRSYAGAARIEARAGHKASAAELARIARKPGELSAREVERWMKTRIAPWPERWAALVEAAKTFEARGLFRDVERLNGCGEPWGRVVRLFWKNAKGHEVSKSHGIHRCKSRFCPSCGRAKTKQRAEEIEKTLEIAGEWGLGPENVRFSTLTVRNGASIPELRALAHEAWGKLQRRRWWNRWVAMWFRGSECVTGKDGNWNFHLHVVLVLWGHRLSYSRLWDEWQSAVGERSQVDIDKLHSQKMAQARRRGGIASAAQYITKYIAKGEELAQIAKGPGGFAHFASATKRLRAFACGGGAPVLRRMAAVLLPNWARRMEWIREGVETRAGVGPVRAEEVDPTTGEAWEIPPPTPGLDAREREVARALCEPLLVRDEKDGGGFATVGRACGKGGRWRRLGHGPVRSNVRKVKEHEDGAPLDALHSIIAGGDWRLFDEREALKDGRILRYRVVLPGSRFAWKDVNRALWDRLVSDQSDWSQRRRAAFKAAAVAGIGDMERLNSLRAARAALESASEGLKPHIARAQKELAEVRRAPISNRAELEEAWLAYIGDLKKGLDLERKGPSAWAAGHDPVFPW